MSIESRIIPEMHTILRTVTGSLSPADIDNAIAETLHHPAFEKGMHVIWELSDADISNVQSDELLEIIEVIRNSVEQRGSHYKIAVVANSNLAFGISRMFEGFGGGLPLAIGIHRSMEAACRWIRGEEETA